MAVPTGSRYERAEHLDAFSHVYNESGYPLMEGEVGLTSLRLQVVAREALYMMTTEQDPGAKVDAYYAKETESFQFLGFKVFEDPKRWTELADLNPQVWYPLDLQMGQFLLVPRS
jgi:hypothetical protein